MNWGLFFGILAIAFCLFCLFVEQVLDFVFWVYDKFDTVIHPPAKMTRNWETKQIVNEMWVDENMPKYFIQEELDKTLNEYKDNQIKFKSLVEMSSADFNVQILKLQLQVAKIGMYFTLLKHIKEECKTPEFIDKISVAMENDVSYVESLNGKKMNDMDVIGFEFVGTFLENLNVETLNNKFKNRLEKIKK